MIIQARKSGNTSKPKKANATADNAINFDSPIVFDLETSSADVKTCEIIQISAYHPETRTSFDRKLKFDVSIANSTALQVNSYDENVWNGEAVEPWEALSDFVRFCNKHRNLPRRSAKGSTWKSVMLMGYNSAKFDIPILERYCAKTFSNFFSPWDYRHFDVLQWAMLVFPGSQSYKLGVVAEKLGCDLTGAHDALVDCLMTVGIAKACLRQLYENNDLPLWAREA